MKQNRTIKIESFHSGCEQEATLDHQKSWQHHRCVFVRRKANKELERCEVFRLMFKFIFCCLLANALVGCASSVRTIGRSKDEKAHQATVEKLTDESLLAKIALEDKYVNVRFTAVRKLTDQAILAKIAVEDKNDLVRKAAVEKLNDQALLVKIAVEDKGWYVRLHAVKRLNDQALLVKITVEDNDEHVRQAAVERLTDQGLLAKVAVEGKDLSVRESAIVRLTDQSLLARLTADDEDASVRLTAIGKLTDQSLLAKLAGEDNDEHVRQGAVERLTDQSLLAKLAVEAKLLDTRVAAIRNVTNQALLCKWAAKDAQAAIRQAAVSGISDGKFLLERLRLEPSAAVRGAIIQAMQERDSLHTAALTAYHRQDREHALHRLKDHFHERAVDVEAAHTDIENKSKALAVESNDEKLLELALKGQFDTLRIAAAQALNNQAALERAATQADDHDVLKILLTKLDNKDALNRIAAAAGTERAMRLAAEQKGGVKSWGNIFATATAPSATAHDLSDALAAVSLFPSVQDEAKGGVQQACLNLISRGDESRIPEMVELLEGYGDKMLAEDYLNCGQPDLDSAGRRWASARGYGVHSGYGSHRATWGSGR
jgi:hypothetical protein